MNRRGAAVGVLLAALLAAGCGDDTSAPSPTDSGTAVDSGGPADTGAATDTAGSDAGSDAEASVSDAGGDAGSFVLSSTAFAEGAPIPIKHTCDGANVSPPLAWTGAPSATKSFVLVVDDPDAPGTTPFVHWVLFDVTGATSLAEGTTAGTSGKSGFGTNAYGGPCPPPGKVHHYRFQLRALDVVALGTAAGATRAAVDGATAGHVLATTTLIGTYTK